MRSVALQRTLQRLFSCQSMQRRTLSVAESAVHDTASELPIYASCVLARAPLVKPLPEDWEIAYEDWAQPIRARKDQQLPQDWQKAKKATVDDATVGADPGQNGASQFEPAPRLTEADKTGDVKSLMRCLDRYLYFVVRTQSGAWGFPTTQNLEKETIRQTGERALSECVGPDADTLFIANWPIGHVALTEVSTPRVEFFMKAQLLTGKVSLLPGTDFVDHAWIGRHELDQYFTNKFRTTLEGALV